MTLKNYLRILVGVDGSEESSHALRRAAQLAKEDGATLFIAQVVDIRSLSSYATVNYNYAESIKDEVVESMEKYKKQAQEEYGAPNVETIIAYGSPRTQMSENIPEEYNIDLIVVGATGLNAAERVLIGSVSERVTRNAPCDVLVVR